MNQKQKAIELIKKFDVKYYHKFTKGKFPLSMHNSVIKECILNCIDEILSINNERMYQLTGVKEVFYKEVKEIIIAEFDELYQAER